MLKSKELQPNAAMEEQNKLDLFYCIVFLISYLALKAVVNGNHYIWLAFTKKTIVSI
ncbi:hypothetical protein [Flavobacterium sp. N1994]|uniref:hypothetical protein n=1 Tax=Flavobacterium sp. N1994 TaxID=2986827 RepID=UPI002222480C|nr:hypothetical protein [Flavobacterium sp. N1994]